jgi:hypothetical protein
MRARAGGVRARWGGVRAERAGDVCVCARACARVRVRVRVRVRARALGNVRAVRGGLRARARLAWIQDDLNELTQQEIISRARGYTHTHTHTQTHTHTHTHCTLLLSRAQRRKPLFPSPLRGADGCGGRQVKEALAALDGGGGGGGGPGGGVERVRVSEGARERGRRKEWVGE